MALPLLTRQQCSHHGRQIERLPALPDRLIPFRAQFGFEVPRSHASRDHCSSQPVALAGWLNASDNSSRARSG